MRQLAISKRPFWYVVQVGVLAALYFAVAKISLLLAIPPGYATAVWPPSGLAVAAVLLAGNRMWPGIWLGAALANLAVQASGVAALLIGTGNALEALVGAALIRRLIGIPTRFESGEDVFKFVAAAAVASTVAATIGVSAIALVGATSLGRFRHQLVDVVAGRPDRHYRVRAADPVLDGASLARRGRPRKKSKQPCSRWCWPPPAISCSAAA